jgi:uncharacterized protein YqeY
MLLDRLKQRILEATKARDAVVRDVLRLALGEAQTAEANSGKPIDDAMVAAVAKKIIKSNHESIAAAGEGERADVLRREIEALSELLPKTMSVDEIVAALAPVRDAILAAKADGPATGIATKHLKQAGLVFEGSDATAAVKAIRTAS